MNMSIQQIIASGIGVGMFASIFGYFVGVVLSTFLRVSLKGMD